MKKTKLPASVAATLQPHFPGLPLDAIEIRLGLPWYVRWLAPIRAVAFTASARRIYCLPEYFRPDLPRGLSLMAHELTHCEQFALYGQLGMVLRYGALYLRGLSHERNLVRAYLLHPLEIKACAHAAEVMQKVNAETYNAS